MMTVHAGLKEKEKKTQSRTRLQLRAVNSSDVADVEELSEPEFTDHADFLVQATPTLALNPNTDILSIKPDTDRGFALNL